MSAAWGERTATASGSDGNYAIPELVPGRYRVTAGAPGFKAFVREEITVRLSVPDVDLDLVERRVEPGHPERALVDVDAGHVGQRHRLRDRQPDHAVAAAEIEDLARLDRRRLLLWTQTAMAVPPAPSISRTSRSETL